MLALALMGSAAPVVAQAGLTIPPIPIDTVASDESSGERFDASILRPGVEQVAVPAGTFPAYRVQIMGSEPQTVWARVEAPHVVLKLEPAGGLLTRELVSLPPE